MDNELRCDGCVWFENCGFGKPCDYFMPVNYERQIERLEAKNGESRFKREWIQYIEYWDDENVDD